MKQYHIICGHLCSIYRRLYFHKLDRQWKQISNGRYWKEEGVDPLEKRPVLNTYLILIGVTDEN